MDILIAGASGAVGRRLVPMLVNRGHRVVGTTTNESKIAELRAMGAEGVVVDLLDRAAVERAVATAAPDVVMHQATALSGTFDLKRLDQFFATTNRLRTDGLDHLLDAAVSNGVKRIIAQSYAGYADPGGADLTDETTPFDPDPVPTASQTQAALAHLEQRISDIDTIDGIGLRYGMLYGPGTSISHDGEIGVAVKRRGMPVVGAGTGVWSFVHVDDAAAAAVAALDAAPGVYNIVDDEPATVADWLPELADALGAKDPRRVPAWLARPMIGAQGIKMMTRVRGASNTKARRTLKWEPAYPTWRQGFRSGL